MRYLTAVAAVGLLLAVTGTAGATTTTLTVYSSYAAAEPVGVFGDSAPGFESGSWKADGVNKSELYLTPDILFGRSITIGDIAEISYYTKKPLTHAVDPSDWYLVLYTQPYTGSPGSGWYGNRIGTEPYFSANLNAPADTWNLWTTADADNQLRWFDSSGGYFGAYTDPFFDDFKAQPVLNRSTSTYAAESIKYFTVVSAGTTWMDGFEGQVDGLTITLTDGPVARVNFEPVPEPVTLAGLVLGVGSLVGYVRRRRRG